MEHQWLRFSRLLNTGIYVLKDSHLEDLGAQYEKNPIYRSEELRRILIEGADNRNVPYVYLDEYQVCFVCVSKEGDYYMAGPMSLKPLERVELHRYYRTYGMSEKEEKQLKHFALAQIFDVVNVMTMILLEKEYSDEELLYENHLIEDKRKENKQEKVLFDFQEDEEEMYHHTYQEERELLNCVREGRTRDALAFNRHLDMDLGKLSSKELNHWKNVMIVAITLCTRAAIEGGLSPAVAYRLSDFYIQKGDRCTEIAQLIDYRNQAVEDLTNRVAKQKKNRSRYNYVERCKDYVEQNYRKKIYLEEMAEALGISSSYLSRLFRKAEGVQLQEYITIVRVEHAANLLVYSDESLARIAEYVGFPTQSYLGKMMKKYKHMSPKAYREANKPIEFS